jgi:3'-phosphoadenosine 5'-phosphosulfate sulfotransferase (PAPS reductase)/FAD synthetase
MNTLKYIVTSSFGNDSIALIQWMHENHKGEFIVLYNDTGWARKDWPLRVANASKVCFEMGITVHITKSVGMEAIVRKNKGWPMPASKMQWCTMHLKEGPSNDFYAKHDPDADLIIVTGRRRAESQNRASLPLHQPESLKHGGRDVYNPLVNFDEAERDIYIKRFGLEPLPHQSMECYPCVCANKTDMLKMGVDEERISLIEKLEIELGHTRYGKPRTMFRPYRHGYAVGIREVFRWAHEPKFKADGYPEEYKLAGIDYTGYNMTGLKGKLAKIKYTQFLEGVNVQIQSGQGMSFDFSATDVAYEINTKAGRDFDSQCSGGFCGN